MLVCFFDGYGCENGFVDTCVATAGGTVYFNGEEFDDLGEYTEVRLSKKDA